jgi:hypothetical protein
VSSEFHGGAQACDAGSNDHEIGFRGNTLHSSKGGSKGGSKGASKDGSKDGLKDARITLKWYHPNCGLLSRIGTL